jgi:hypothetical protein
MGAVEDAPHAPAALVAVAVGRKNSCLQSAQPGTNEVTLAPRWVVVGLVLAMIVAAIVIYAVTAGGSGGGGGY